MGRRGGGSLPCRACTSSSKAGGTAYKDTSLPYNHRCSGTRPVDTCVPWLCGSILCRGRWPPHRGIAPRTHQSWSNRNPQTLVL